MIATKYKFSARGPKEYVIHYGLTTKALDAKFALPRHFIMTVYDVDTGSKQNATRIFVKCFVETWIN